jgi:hypothetical protein
MENPNKNPGKLNKKFKLLFSTNPGNPNKKSAKSKE